MGTSNYFEIIIHLHYFSLSTSCNILFPLLVGMGHDYDDVDDEEDDVWIFVSVDVVEQIDE